MHLKILKKLQHLVDICIVILQGASEWAATLFIIPKKDGRVNWVLDSFELNKVAILSF